MDNNFQLTVGESTIMNVKKLDGFVEKFLLVDDKDNVVYKIIRQNRMLVVDKENNPVEADIERKILSFFAQKISDRENAKIESQTSQQQSQETEDFAACFT